MALRRTGQQLLSYQMVAREKSMYTNYSRSRASFSHDYVTSGQLTGRKLNYFLKRERPWWKSMPKYKKPYKRYHWFEPLPKANYLTWKADGIYTVEGQAIFTLQHVIHQKMLPIKMHGRTFTMPLVRWLIGSNIRQTAGSGLNKNIPEYKLTKPKYWSKT
eukprot:TRINITY_DN22598_c0_g1_i1.p1 TRINITY_DN22598_c0_g1~~TRINITY_DN22598_c0_g1_i1.p1  ORF type:complete len:177 (+),score=37.78 TRINITY_DN22598_c0_g1_i1:54-533(+)